MPFASEFEKPGAKIKVFGVGGGGTNAVSTMIRSNIDGVDFIAANTDIQSLSYSLAPSKIQLGKELTKGLGAGADPDIGRDAALEDRHEIQEALSGADMVFVTAGMGGGTGTGGAAIVAQIAKESGALTVGVVTKPFVFEGKRRRKHAELGIERLRDYVDTLVVVPNQRLLQVAAPDLSMLDAFKMADDVLVNAVRGISDIINIPGVVNVDFADVRTVMSSTGQALMGVGAASGEDRAIKAANEAISSPLLEDLDIQGATGILINITAGDALTLFEVNEACTIVQEAAHEDANVVFGSVVDPEIGDELRVTVIATGFPVGQLKSEMSAVEKAPLQRLTTQPTQTPVEPSPTLPLSFSSRDTESLTRATMSALDETPSKQPTESSAPAPIEDEPQETEDEFTASSAFSLEIDRKIDEALSLAKQVSEKNRSDSAAGASVTDPDLESQEHSRGSRASAQDQADSTPPVA